MLRYEVKYYGAFLNHEYFNGKFLKDFFLGKFHTFQFA